MRACIAFALAAVLVGCGSAHQGGSSPSAVSPPITQGNIVGKSNLIAVANVSVNGTQEPVLTDNNGFTLYTFALDSTQVSNCSGSCLTEWPPQHVPPGSTVAIPFATIPGNDGQTQLTLNGLPLYHFSADVKPGDAFGQYPQWSAVVVAP